jgi:signal transduction histidine kinase
MPHTQSITDRIARTYQSFASSAPESKFRWAEYLLIVVSVLNQLAWKRTGDDTAMTSVVIPIVLLIVLAILNSLPIARDNGRRLVLKLAELALIAVASFLGTHRVYRHLYLIIIGKGALLLNRTSLIIVILVALAQQIAFVLELEPIKNRLVPMFTLLSRQSIVSLEYVVYYALSLLLIVSVSMLLRAEQESRFRAARLTAEMDSMLLTLERERIARDIHDSLGHALTGLNVQLQLAQRVQDSDPAKSHEAIALARGFASRAVSDVRRAVRAVRDNYFDFPSAVKELVDTIESNGDCTVTMTLDPLSASAQLSHNLYFLIQESLTNVQRHAHSTSITLELSCDDQIHLHVKDNGVGFSSEDIVPGFGITGMEERVASLGGKITFVSAPGEGTDIQVTIPLEATLTKDSSNDQSSRS